jgi:DNA-binding NarL/FixJ family response regulator
MRLLIADDHLLFKEALITFINAKRPDWYIETTANIDETMIVMNAHDASFFHLVLLDLRMPGMDDMRGIEVIREMRNDQPLAILTGVAEEHHVKRAMEMGVMAYFPKTLSGKALIKAIEYVVTSKQRFIPKGQNGLDILPAYQDDHNSEFNSEMTESSDNLKLDFLSHLTKREMQVLNLVAQGLSNKDIAEELSLKPSTIKIHVGNACRKLGVENRTQAAILCHQHGLHSTIRESL